MVKNPPTIIINGYQNMNQLVEEVKVSNVAEWNKSIWKAKHAQAGEKNRKGTRNTTYNDSNQNHYVVTNASTQKKVSEETNQNVLSAPRTANPASNKAST